MSKFELKIADKWQFYQWIMRLFYSCDKIKTLNMQKINTDTEFIELKHSTGNYSEIFGERVNFSIDESYDYDQLKEKILFWLKGVEDKWRN